MERLAVVGVACTLKMRPVIASPLMLTRYGRVVVSLVPLVGVSLVPLVGVSLVAPRNILLLASVTWETLIAPVGRLIW